MNRFVVIAASLLAGCSSLIDGPCASGYELSGGQCVSRGSEVDGGPDTQNISPDGGTVTPDGPMTPDAPGPDVVPPPDVDPGPVCGGADLTSDPDNCGTCDHVCASGICDASHCVGEPWGHVVAIGHDYASSHAAQRRVLANALSLGAAADLAVATWPGVSPTGTYGMGLGLAMVERSHPWHAVSFPADPSASFDGVDVVIVPPEMGDGDQVEAKAAEWATAFDSFLRKGGVIVVLATKNGTVERFGHGAALFEVGPVVDVTDQSTKLVDGTDSVAEGVVVPYKAETTSVAFPSATDGVVSTTGGDVVVFHVSR